MKTTQTEALKLLVEALSLYETRSDGLVNKALAAGKKALAQPEQEPVAYLVTGPYEKMAFSDIGSANAYCGGLNKGFDTDAYLVSPLYSTPPQRKPLSGYINGAGINANDSPHIVVEKIERAIKAAHGIKE